ADFGRALDLNPDYAQALANRASAFHLQGRHDLALADFTRAVVLDSKYGAAYCLQRGLLQVTQRRIDGALADLTVALLLDPKNTAAGAAREEALRLREVHFEVHLPGLSGVSVAPAAPALPPDVALPPPEDPARTRVPPPAAVTQTQIEV